MKKILVLFCLLVFVRFATAQSLHTGQQYLYYQKYASAEQAFHDHLKQNPADEEAWLGLVKSYLLQNKMRQAVDSFAMAPAEIINQPHALIAKGILLLEANKKDSARTFFDKAIAESKKHSPVPVLVADAQVFSDNGDINYAIDLIKTASKKVKNDAFAHVTLGKCYRALHDGSNAYRAFYSAIQKDDNYAEAYYELGKIFSTQKNTEMFLSYFNKAVAADNNYAPAYYELYYHYMYTNPPQAMDYFEKYRKLSDPSPQHDYAHADLLYLTKKYDEAIAKAKTLIGRDTLVPRLYKLIAYSYAELKDTTQALSYMTKYFDKGNDSIYIAKDFETMAQLFISPAINQPDSAMAYYQKAADFTSDSTMLYGYYAELSKLAKSVEDYAAQAKWLGKYYMGNEKAGNVDLFNWGIAAYRSGDYNLSDTVFAIYTQKYPEQTFGYYWRAKSNAAIDTAMEAGLAIPHYQKLAEITGTDSLSVNDKRWITEAYSYLAAYETNTKKNYEQAISYFEKILSVDPENESAKKYIAMLQQTLEVKQEDATN